MKKKIAEKIRQARVIQNLSQENIAMELGISVGAYSNIERGKSEVTVSRLYAIAKILKTRITDLLYEKEEISTGRFYIKDDPFLSGKDVPGLVELKEQLDLLKKEVAALKSGRAKKAGRK